MNNHAAAQKRNQKINTRTLTSTAMLAAISYLLAYIEFSVPLSPSFAKMDFSDFPALIGAFAFSPMVGLMIEFLKNILQLFSTSTAGIGELANFIMGGSFVYTAGLIYSYQKTKKRAIVACIVASTVMGIVAVITNYFILLPMFEMFMPLEQVIASFGAFMPFIQTKLDIVLLNVLPANILKGLAVSLLTIVVYKRLTSLLKGINER